jgi:hypothetical protein
VTALGDEGRQRGTSLYRACGRGTEIAAQQAKGSVRRPARLKGGEMDSVIAVHGVPLGQGACRSYARPGRGLVRQGVTAAWRMCAWAVDAAVLRAERRRISSTSTRVKSSRWATFTVQQVNPV